MNTDVQTKFKEKFVISTSQFDLCSEDNNPKNDNKVMVDQEENVNLGPIQIAR